MLKFDKELMITGVEMREGKNGSYILIKVMMENDETANFMYKGDKSFDWTSIKKYSLYKLSLQVNVGKYVNVAVLSISPISK